MPLTKEQKEDILQALISQFKEAKSVVFADYQGLSVKQVTELRSKLREKAVTFQIVKKTLIRIASKEAGYEQEIPADVLEGPVAVAVSMEDELAGAKAVHEFAKKNKKLQLRGALFEGRVLSVAETKQLAELPGKEELIAKLLYLLKYPVQGFHGVLNNTLAGFVRALNAIKEQKEQAA